MLRLSYPNDIEYKYDEWYMFDQTQRVSGVGALPRLGMPSGIGVRNPALSIWIFIALARISDAATPPALAGAVQWLNVGALAALLLLAVRWPHADERENWLWAMALASVNPMAVLLQRKIWAQSTLPIFCVLFLYLFSRRSRPAHACAWGAACMVLGQIHMTGFLFAAAVVVTVVVYERLEDGSHTVWPAWLLGASLGSLTLAEWPRYVSGLFAATPSGPLTYVSDLPARFWIDWVEDVLGIGLAYIFGADGIGEYLAYPVLWNRPLYLAAAGQHLAVIVVTVVAIRWMWRRIAREHEPQGASSNDVRVLLVAAIAVFGIALTVLGSKVQRHYLMVTFPLEWLSCALIARQAFSVEWSRRLLAMLWTALLVMSLTCLLYIHVNGGAPSGDYGIAYGHQPVRPADQRR